MAGLTGTRKQPVGIIGLGIMGGAYAQNLRAAGWPVFGHDTAPARRRAMARAGVVMVANAAEVAAKAPVVITSLPKASALAESAIAIAKAGVPARVIVETSTFALDDKSAARGVLSPAGHVLLDCPVSGTGIQARVKDIVIYASGGSSQIRRLRPLFADFSRAVHDLGEFGNGSRMKYVANLLVAVHNVASAEALVLGTKAGLPRRLVYDMVKIGAANSRVFELRAPLMVRDRYDDPTMKVAIWQKDMKIIGEFAQALGAPTPLFSATLPVYAAAMANGHGADDTAVVCAVLEAMAGIKRGKRTRKDARSR